MLRLIGNATVLVLASLVAAVQAGCSATTRVYPATDGGDAAGGTNGDASVGGAGAGGGQNSGGAGGLGGNATGGKSSACNPACSGTTVCNESAKTCVQCIADGNCATPTPACNTATNTCVACMKDGNCSAPTPACNAATNTCVACTKDGNCSGATPACNLVANSPTVNTCVQCVKDGNCSGNTPFCNTATNLCMQCRTNTDCTSPTASLCSGGTCSPCTQDADCSQITGKNVCNANTCVTCTGAKYTACGQSATGTPLVCDSLSHNCSPKTQRSAGLCQTCVSDAQCQAGEMCVQEMYNGSPVGYFCFYKQGDTTNGAPAVCGDTGRPYVKVITGATSIDSQTADICSLRVSTCPALNQFSQTNCSPSGTPSDANCGFAPGVDSKCAAFTTTQYLCTVTCASDFDCKAGFSCNTGVNPNVCNLL